MRYKDDINTPHNMKSTAATRAALLNENAPNSESDTSWRLCWSYREAAIFDFYNRIGETLTVFRNDKNNRSNHKKAKKLMTKIE